MIYKISHRINDKLMLEMYINLDKKELHNKLNDIEENNNYNN